MNRVFVSYEDTEPPFRKNRLCSFALKVLDEIDVENWDLSVLLCTDRIIKKLNRKYRNKNEATDVLSFCLGAEEPGEDGKNRCLPGDVVISLDTMEKNARYFNISEDEELRRLIIHGILHLKGLDHQSNDHTEPMIIRQEQILEKLKNECILPQSHRGKK